jgi:hypothetical protein
VPNIAHADDTERLTGELGSGILQIIAPAVFLDRAMGRECVTRQRNHLAEDQFGD